MVLVAAGMVGGVAVCLEYFSPTAQIQQWVKDHPDQPKPEFVGSGVSEPLTALLWLATALGVATLAAAFLWLVRRR
jgi:hypothetical protein